MKANFFLKKLDKSFWFEIFGLCAIFILYSFSFFSNSNSIGLLTCFSVLKNSFVFNLKFLFLFFGLFERVFLDEDRSL